MKSSLLVLTLFLITCISTAQHITSNSLTICIDNQLYNTAILQVDDTVNLCKLKQLGVKINTQLNTIITCYIPSEKTNTIKCLPFVLGCEVSGYSNSMRAKNNSARAHSNVDKVHEGTNNGLKTDYDGTNVIVGIVDIGFQNNHPTFYDKTGTQLRVKRFWDQSATSGLAPGNFSYGKLCADSNAIIAQIDVDGTHATHVAGIAGGSGFSTPNLKYRGMAPNADLVFVKIKYANDILDGSAYGDFLVANPTIIDAYKYIFDYADSVGKPAVINLSWGMHTGPHDGTSLFDKAVEELVKGKGHVIVGANGNDGGSQMHFEYQFNNDTIRTIPYDNNRSNTVEESIYVDLWGAKNTAFKLQIHLYDTLKNKLASSPLISTINKRDIGYWFHNGLDTAWVQLAIDSSYINNQKPNILIIGNHNRPKKNFFVLEMIGTTGRIDGWNSGDAYKWSNGGFTRSIKSAIFDESEGFKGGDNQNTLGENGGTGKGTISVGAYINRNAWITYNHKLTDNSKDYSAGSAAGFSSNGPSIDGRVKPDISAPGQHITSAGNRNVLSIKGNNDLMDISIFNGDTNLWTQYSGTSMAAPHTTGIVALLLQANAHLSAAQIAEILRKTAYTDEFTGTVPNNKWGYGKIDALAAIKEVEKTNSLSYSNLNEIKIYPNPTSNFLKVDGLSGKNTITIFNFNGKLINTLTTHNASEMIQLPEISGIYILSISNGIVTKTERIVKY